MKKEVVLGSNSRTDVLKQKPSVPGHYDKIETDADMKKQEQMLHSISSSKSNVDNKLKLSPFPIS